MDVDEADDASRWIGRRLREIREQQRLTLGEVAERTGGSPSHLSRIEKGQRQPSIGTLMQLARTYGMSLSQLVDDEPGDAPHVVRAAEAPVHDSPDGRYVAMSALGSALQVVRVELRPRRRPALVQHAGEEWIHVLDGEATVELDGELVQLAAGDAIHFDAAVPHGLHHAGRSTATVLVVSSAPATPGHAPSGHVPRPAD